MHNFQKSLKYVFGTNIKWTHTQRSHSTTLLAKKPVRW